MLTSKFVADPAASGSNSANPTKGWAYSCGTEAQPHLRLGLVRIDRYLCRTTPTIGR